jgi:hypothetical protein
MLEAADRAARNLRDQPRVTLTIAPGTSDRLRDAVLRAAEAVGIDVAATEKAE